MTKTLSPLEVQVERMAKRGNSAEHIAEILGLSRRTLYRRGLQKAMARGRAQMCESLRHAQLTAALIDRNPALLIWLGKQELSQREPPHGIEISGTVGLEIASPDELRTGILGRLARIEAAVREAAAAGESVGAGTPGAGNELRLLGAGESAGAD